MSLSRGACAVGCAAALLLGAGCSSAPASGDRGADGGQKARVLAFWKTFNEATRLRMAGDDEAAAKAYEEALVLDAQHEDCLYYLGQCRRNLGAYAQAQAAFDRLVQINPESTRGHLALGALLASAEEAAPWDLDSAESHLRRAHAINGEETGPMVRLGEILIVRGESAEALGWLDDASRTNPKSVEAAFLSGYVRWEAGDRGSAALSYRRAVEAARTDAPVKGVMSEGDRKADLAKTTRTGAGAAPVAAPPLRSPMGRTLFGAFVAPLREQAGAGGEARLLSADLDTVYSQVRDHARALRARQVVRAVRSTD